MHSKLETSLQRATNELPRASFAYIASAPVEKLREFDAITRPDAPSRSAQTAVRRFAVAFASFALLFLAGFGVFWQNFAVESRITIDVNPSFEITTSHRDRVIAVKALNEDAAEVLAGNHFRGQPVDDAVEALFSLLGKSRFMSPEKNAILLSVRGRNEAHDKELAAALTSHIEQALAGTDIIPHIVSQILTEDAAIRREAQRYHVSPGKLQLAQKLQARSPSYSIEELTALPLTQLLAMLGVEMDFDDDADPDEPVDASWPDEGDESEDDRDEESEPDESSDPPESENEPDESSEDREDSEELSDPTNPPTESDVGDDFEEEYGDLDDSESSAAWNRETKEDESDSIDASSLPEPDDTSEESAEATEPPESEAAESETSEDASSEAEESAETECSEPEVSEE